MKYIDKHRKQLFSAKRTLRIDIIACCDDCSERVYVGNDLHCGIAQLKTTFEGPIPDWCPLEILKK